MDKTINQFLKELEGWFTQRPLWQQDAARRIIEKGAIDATDQAELIALCKQEAGIPAPNQSKLIAQGIPPRSLEAHANGAPITLRLEEISDVKGINALAPRKPLTFGDGPLTIIYGTTGSGKSGYVRILKHACGARKAGNLHGNIFDNQKTNQECTFKVNINTVSKEFKWSESIGVIDDIKEIEIYDTDCAHVYLTEDNEVVYEPWVLLLFTQLTEVCKLVGGALKDKIGQSISKLPPMPAQYQETKIAVWYTNLNHQTKWHHIDARRLWNQNLKKHLVDLNRRLSEPDPAKQAILIRNTKTNLLTLYNELKKIRDQLSNEKCSQYLEAIKDAAAKRKVADEDAKKVFANAPLDGVGSESWRLLWEKARAYSENIAYQGIPFPNLSEEARCALCQQILGPEARERFTSFEDFVKGALQNQASVAEEQVKTLKEEIEDILLADNLTLRMDSAGITADTERQEIFVFHNIIIACKDSLFKAKALPDVADLPDETLLVKLKALSEKLERRAQKYDEDAKKQNRDKLEKTAKELEARKWLSEQKDIIYREVSRLIYVNLLNKARRSTNTKPLSDLKSKLADIIISSAFIKRFKDELKALGASRIKVELVKTKTEYGHVFHKIQLKNCATNICPTSILSEGEFRIVSLAAFLADVESHRHITPFIFDDPISSLDQDFEEKTAERLIDLCASRQLIVFTHRLSLMVQLKTLAKKAGITPYIICVRNESWGSGEPGDTPIYAKNPKGALNLILNERLPRARKVFEEIGRAEYEDLAKGICVDIRILIERLVENDFLSDIVQRFRREVMTKDKIHRLAKITADDCQLIDDYMSKYSKYKHSQSYEAPIQILDPDEIEKDLKDILSWLEDFKKR